VPTVKIIVGLGNPGLRYRRTRHNLGFMALGALADLRGMRFRRARFRSSQARGRIGGEEVVLVRPMTFMNLSGESVARVVKHLSCSLRDLLVICDDVDLDLGRMRLRRAGSAGGHRGLQSIIHHLQSEEFARLRLGIGAPPDGTDMVAYVLRPFGRGERPAVRDLLARASQAAETWVYHGIDEAMNRFN
jgi:PTH1 family peptidyl-tRNA hydrolase